MSTIIRIVEKEREKEEKKTEGRERKLIVGLKETQNYESKIEMKDGKNFHQILPKHSLQRLLIV